MEVTYKGVEQIEGKDYDIIDNIIVFKEEVNKKDIVFSY